MSPLLSSKNGFESAGLDGAADAGTETRTSDTSTDMNMDSDSETLFLIRPSSQGGE